MTERITITKEQVMAWLKIFCRGDPIDEAFQEKIIDVFVNAVYLYDDHLIIYYNIKGGKQVSYMEMLESTEDFDVDAMPGEEMFVHHCPWSAKTSGGQTPQIIFSGGTFGIIFPLPEER